MDVRQSGELEKLRVYRSSAPTGLWRQSTRGARVEFALQLRRQRNRRKVLELYVISHAEAAANRHLSAAGRIIGEAHTGRDVVLVRFGFSKSDHTRSIGNCV